MKFLYVTDIHGIQWKYDHIFQIAKSFKVDLVINSGDMLQKKGNFLIQDRFIKNFLDDYFSKFNNEGIYYLTMLANDDLIIFDELLQNTCNKYPYVVNIAQKKFEFKDYEFIGMNWVSDFPFALKDRARKDSKDFIFPKQFGKPVISTLKGWKKIEDWYAYAETLPTIEEEMNRLVKPSRMEKTIYIIHGPPSNMFLDVCQDGSRVGSKAVYEFLKQKQPLMSFHGHIHESPEISNKWFEYLNKTLCIQPGQSHHFQDYLIFTTIELENLNFERFKVGKMES